jgi:hypothetical protein
MAGPERVPSNMAEKDALAKMQHMRPSGSSYTSGTHEEKQLVKKIDWHLLPAIWLLYLIAVRIFAPFLE